MYAAFRSFIQLNTKKENVYLVMLCANDFRRTLTNVEQLYSIFILNVKVVLLQSIA